MREKKTSSLDLDFNERVNAAGLLLCKCQRFNQAKKQMKSGGCAEFTQRADFKILDDNDIENEDHLRTAFKHRGGSVGFTAWCD